MNTLYEYQNDGVAFLLSGSRRYLTDGMGLGKTVQAAAAADILASTLALKAGRRRRSLDVLVVGPASALPNWRALWRVWGPPGSFVTVSFASRALEQARGADWDLVIIDEAHYCKSRKANRTRHAIFTALSAPRVWLLSGTPMPYHPGELWTVLRAFFPEVVVRLGCRTYDEWFEKFCLYRHTQHGRNHMG